MSRVILLDAGPLGIVSNPRFSTQTLACHQWVKERLTSGAQVLIPEIADYEVRRELLRANKTRSLARLTRRVKEKIEEAALVSHQTLTDFVVTSLLRASDEALKHHQAIRLTNRDRDLFLAALDSDERPSPALRKAAQRFKRRSA